MTTVGTTPDAAGDQRDWGIGELAAAAGVSVRTLHHYDRIGLLVPAGRAVKSQRRYGPAEVERLYRILALRRQGIELAAIGALLQDGRALTLDVSREQLQDLEADLAVQQRLREQLRDMIDVLERAETPSPDAVVGVIQAMSGRAPATA
jgi:MerR family transcriptional regulator, thiopeptide resistance regulator